MSTKIGKERAEECAENAGADWQVEAYKAFVMFAKKNKTFTTNEPRRWLQEKKKIFPHDNRAWGHIAVQAKKNKIISSTGKFVWTGSHGCPVQVWKSEICK